MATTPETLIKTYSIEDIKMALERCNFALSVFEENPTNFSDASDLASLMMDVGTIGEIIYEELPDREE